MSGTGRIWLQLFTSSINTIPTWPLLVLNSRVCPWVQVKVLKIMLTSGETWLEEFNPRSQIERWFICFWGGYLIYFSIT